MTPTLRLPRELPTIVLIAVLGGALAYWVPAFLRPDNLTVVGQNAGFIGVMACGEGLVILSAGLDLSVGSILAVSSCATAAALAVNLAWPIACLIGLATACLAGAINGALVTYRRLPPILTTLATLLLFRYGASIATKSRSYGPFPAAFVKLGAGWIPTLILIVATAIFVMVTLRTPFGRWNLAIGSGEQAALLSGVPVDRVKRGAYVLSGLCAGIGALIVMAFNNNAQSTVGQGLELDVIAACVVGGVRITGGDGSLLGAALGAVLIALLRNALVLTHRPIEQYGLFTGGVILAAAVLEQIRGRRTAATRAAA